MNKSIVAVLSFTIGAAAGVLATKNYFDKKYSDIANKEIKDAVTRHNTVKEGKDPMTEPEFVKKKMVTNEKPDLEEYIRKTNLTSYATVSKPKDEEPVDPKPKEAAYREPYVISPDEYDGNADFDKITLTYYQDGVLADDNDEEIEDPDETVGEESLDHFGEYEEDIVYVRNERLGIDYEVSRDRRRYADVVDDKPYIR